MLKFCFIVVSAMVLFSNEVAMQSSPPGQIKSISITDCQNNLQANLYNINAEGDKALDASVEFKEDFDAEKAKFTLDIAKWEDNNWNEDVYNVDGELCKHIKEYIPDIWKKFQDVVNTPFTGEDFCQAKAGRYEVKEFEAFSNEVKLKSTFYGKLKLTFKIFQTMEDDADMVLCAVYQCEVSKN